MKKIGFILITGLMLLGCDNKRGAFLETVDTNNTIAIASQKLIAALPEKGLLHMQTIDHSANAKKVGMDLKPETVVVFGNPGMGTKLMQCNPSIGLDLPMRMLFTSNYDKQTKITYTNPEYWSLKHNIKDKTCLEIIRQAHIALQELAESASK
jgi:uncharacterized protein (DUF302 family)